MSLLERWGRLVGNSGRRGRGGKVARINRPDPCYLDQMEYLGFKNGNMLWRSLCGRRYYTWDSLHGEIEVFNKRGRHLGVLEARTGVLIKDAVAGRSIDVS